MTLLTLVQRSLRRRRASSLLLMFSVGLGVALVLLILIVSRAIDEAYENQGSGIPIIVGPRGSRTDLVLSVVYQRQDSPGLMPFRAYEEIANQPWVALSVPVALGDSYEGFRIMGTSTDIFDERFQPLPGASFRFDAGRPFFSDKELVRAILTKGLPTDEIPKEAVLGHEVARRLGLRTGHTLEPVHGLEEDGHAHEGEWVVTGVLAKTGTAMDRVIFINLESFYAIGEHREGALLRSEDGTLEPGISAVMIYPKGKTAQSMMLPVLNKRTDIQAVNPTEEIAKLLDLVGSARQVLLVCAWAVVFVGAAGVGASLTSAMSARLREVAVLRALGAKRRLVLALLVMEGASLGLVGGLFGTALGHAALFVLEPLLVEAAGCPLDLGAFSSVGRHGVFSVLPLEPVVLLVVSLLGALAGLSPGIGAYRAPVVDGLRSPS